MLIKGYGIIMFTAISITKFFHNPVFERVSYLVINFFDCIHLKVRRERVTIEAIRRRFNITAPVYIMMTVESIVSGSLWRF